jgi:hypothetical protein
MVIEGLIEVYDSVVEGNGRIDVLSNFQNYFIYFNKKRDSERAARVSESAVESVGRPRVALALPVAVTTGNHFVCCTHSHAMNIFSTRCHL